MKKLFIFTLLLLLWVGFIVGKRYSYVKRSYPEVLQHIESERKYFLKSYQSAKSTKEKNEILDQAGRFLNRILPDKILPAWYGTLWSFNGDAEFPLKGRIACGSFVEKVLKHSGFQIDSRMSAQPSEYIIMNMVNDNRIERFSNIPIERFNEAMKKMGEGIYIVGLDNHVGFLYIHKGKYRFVHAHGYLCVLPEIPSLSPTLRKSEYRVIGKLFDNEMIEQWLSGEDIPLRFDYFKSLQGG